MYVLSSAHERCLMSGQSVVAGLLQSPADNPHKLPINWQPVAINSIPRDRDTVIDRSEQVVSRSFYCWFSFSVIFFELVADLTKSDMPEIWPTLGANVYWSTGTRSGILGQHQRIVCLLSKACGRSKFYCIKMHPFERCCSPVWKMLSMTNCLFITTHPWTTPFTEYDQSQSSRVALWYFTDRRVEWTEIAELDAPGVSSAIVFTGRQKLSASRRNGFYETDQRR